MTDMTTVRCDMPAIGRRVRKKKKARPKGVGVDVVEATKKDEVVVKSRLKEIFPTVTRCPGFASKGANKRKA